MTQIGNFDFLPYKGRDSFEKYKSFHNTISKNAVIKHLESIEAWITGMTSLDVFTGDELQSGAIHDGDYVLPLEFIHYYKNYDIGIPYEYEEYLKVIL